MTPKQKDHDDATEEVLLAAEGRIAPDGRMVWMRRWTRKVPVRDLVAATVDDLEREMNDPTGEIANAKAAADWLQPVPPEHLIAGEGRSDG